MQELPLTKEDGGLLPDQEIRRKINELIRAVADSKTPPAAVTPEMAVDLVEAGLTRTETAPPVGEGDTFRGWRAANASGTYFMPPPGYMKDGVHIAGMVPRADVPKEVLEWFTGDSGEEA